MKDTQDFLSCDWGTTAFRLRWVRGTERSVIREVREQTGAKALYEQAIREGALTEEGRAGVFARFLHEQLEKLAAGETIGAPPIPLVISGMASSSVGWRELPYAKAPFDLDGKGLRFEELKWNSPAWIGPTYLISGVSTQHDIMRGEEMEIIGLMFEPSLRAARGQCLLVLPGTHSKHIWIRNESVVDFRTSMTGELFDVLGKHSLLRASVDLSAPELTSFRGSSGGAPHPIGRSEGVRGTGEGTAVPWREQRTVQALPEDQRLAFQEGVLWAKQRGLAGGLFRVRTRAVLDHRPLPDNTAFFSGLLIGAELRHVVDADNNSPVVLGAAGHLSELYAAALDILLGRSGEWLQIPAEQVERSTVAGHAIFLAKRAPANLRSAK